MFLGVYKSSFCLTILEKEQAATTLGDLSIMVSLDVKNVVFSIIDPEDVDKLVAKVEDTAERICNRVTAQCHLWLEALNDFISFVQKFSHSERESRRRLNKVVDKLKLAVQKYHLFLENLEDLFSYGLNKDRMRRIKEGIQGKDNDELLDFADILIVYIKEAEVCNRETEEALLEIMETSDSEAGECKKKAEEVAKSKKFTQALGGTLSGGAAVAGGVTGSILVSVAAGVPTLGLGTIIGLSITAGCTFIAGAAVCVGTGLTTASIASELEGIKKKFSSLSESFDKVYNSASTVLDDLHSLEGTLKSVSSQARKFNAKKKSSTISNLIDALDGLHIRFDEYYRQISEYLQPLRTAEDKLKHLKSYDSLCVGSYKVQV